MAFPDKRLRVIADLSQLITIPPKKADNAAKKMDGI
jgi:hypothetical protein